MEEYQKRMVQEAEGLRVNIEKLDAFVKSKPFESLSLIKCQLLTKQLAAMEEYIYYLQERINLEQ